MVHGAGWRPGERIQVSLDGRGERPGPVVDRMGTFNYAVNQGHEFVAGPLPPGDERSIQRVVKLARQHLLQLGGHQAVR